MSQGSAERPRKPPSCPGQTRLPVVPDVVRQRDRRRQAARRRAAVAARRRRGARPIVRSAGLGVLGVASAGAARRSASSSRSTNGRCRRWTWPAARRSCRSVPAVCGISSPTCRPGTLRGDRLEFAADLGGRVGLGVPRFVLRRPAEMEQDDARFRLAERTARCRRDGFARSQQRRQRQARQRQAADAQPFASRQAVAQARARSFNTEHDDLPLNLCLL